MTATFTVHVAGPVQDALQRCSRCGGILMDRRGVAYELGVEPPEPRFWEEGQGVMVGHSYDGGPSMMTGMLGMNPDRDRSDEVDCEPQVRRLLQEGEYFAVADDVVWLEQAQVLSVQVEDISEDGVAAQQIVMVETAGVEMGDRTPRTGSLAMSVDAAAALAASLALAARAGLEAGERDV